MPTVAVNQPKSPVTKGSGGIAAATLPNICKMPGPPAPFVPVPLPNIGTSDNSPQGYSTSVTMDGDPVAIQGASFLSKGDVASQGTGGGIISSNVQGPTTFIGPGALNVQVEGKNVQLLGDPMLNNGGPSGSPANAATMAGIVQGPVLAQSIRLGVEVEVQVLCELKCECEAMGRGQECVQEILDTSDAQMGGQSPVKAEVSYNMDPPDGPPPAPVAWNYPFRGAPARGCPRPDAIIVDRSIGGKPPVLARRQPQGRRRDEARERSLRRTAFRQPDGELHRDCRGRFRQGGRHRRQLLRLHEEQARAGAGHGASHEKGAGAK